MYSTHTEQYTEYIHTLSVIRMYVPLYYTLACVIQDQQYVCIQSRYLPVYNTLLYSLLYSAERRGEERRVEQVGTVTLVDICRVLQSTECICKSSLVWWFVFSGGLSGAQQQQQQQQLQQLLSPAQPSPFPIPQFPNSRFPDPRFPIPQFPIP